MTNQNILSRYVTVTVTFMWPLWLVQKEMNRKNSKQFFLETWRAKLKALIIAERMSFLYLY